jgi:hypothetical protein
MLPTTAISASTQALKHFDRMLIIIEINTIILKPHKFRTNEDLKYLYSLKAWKLVTNMINLKRKIMYTVGTELL